MNEKEDELAAVRGLVNAFLIMVLLALIIGYGWWCV